MSPLEEQASMNTKRVVVTGGSDGIGFAITTAFAASGAAIFIVARDSNKLVAIQEKMQAKGTEVHVFATDLASSQGVRNASAAILGAWSEIDVLINNAGVGRFLPFDKTTEDMLELHLNLNVRAPFLLTQALFEALKARQGSIINISSYFARRMLPALPSSAYSLSKGAIESFTKELAFEAGPYGVRVNAIAPGTVRTPLMQSNLASMPEENRTKLMGMVKTIYPLGRLGVPEEIAGAAVFLASEQARWITGAILPVDGGLTTN
jgi:NAD(P)-dependent dehydrogenase (short-subunit alcohol dehydrogenase family)